MLTLFKDFRIFGIFNRLFSKFPLVFQFEVEDPTSIGNIIAINYPLLMFINSSPLP